MIDASHGNSRKDPQNQKLVARDLADQLAAGERRIFGTMIESHLVAGSQPLTGRDTLRYGQSITDACLGWDDTVALLDVLADAVAQRRRSS